MSILVYGGGFNPPHLGHVSALESAVNALSPDRILVIPDGTPPHKPLPAETPDGEERLRLCRLAFQDVPNAQISDLSVRRTGPCYMADTVASLRNRFPGEDLILLMGADMLLCLDRWVRAEELLSQCSIAALCREYDDGDALEKKVSELKVRFGAKVWLLQHRPFPASSSLVRKLLPERGGRELVPAPVYQEIIRKRLYNACPDLGWLREQVYGMLKPSRIPHVAGCEQTARHLAERWGLDPDRAAEAGILHDMTKRWTDAEQLSYSTEHGIRLDEGERENAQLLHARTGAVAAEELFGADGEICDAIRWHTTGKPGMSPFEMVLYLADMTEPNRSFPGVEQLRCLCEEDLELAMAQALRLSVDSIQQRHMHVYKDTLEAYHWYSARVEQKKEE